MPKLNDAEKLYFNQHAAPRAYLGGTEVWVEPVPGLVWLAGWRAAIAGAVATGTGAGGQFGQVHTAPLPNDLVYFEMELDQLSMDLRAGIWAVDVPTDFGATAPVGQYIAGAQSSGATAGNAFNIYVYSNNSFVAGVPPNTSGDPVRRIGWAVRVGDRRGWARQVWPAGQSAWIGGGDPVADTAPSAEFSGSEVIRVAATVVPGGAASLIAPLAHYRAPPTGFTAI